MSGLIFNIQRYSIHDGPGIRTLVFMKGCPLKCKWCSNPEGQSAQPQLGFVGEKCVGAEQCHALCREACPAEAITMSEEGRPQTDRKACRKCGSCVKACYYGARRIIGRSVEVEELLSEVERDKPFYDESGGGVTVGGGEPLMQSDFVARFLQTCKAHFLNTAIETCGYAPFERLEACLEYAGHVFYDIKHMDSLTHKELTGVPNELILENARRLLKNGKCEVIVRIPVIPGYNDSVQNISDTATFVASCGGKALELLPYHRFGTAKYRELNMEYGLEGLQPPDKTIMDKLNAIIQSFGLR